MPAQIIIGVEEVLVPVNIYHLRKNKNQADATYCTSYRLNMFQALLCPSTGAHEYNAVYQIGRVVLGLLYVGG